MGKGYPQIHCSPTNNHDSTVITKSKHALLKVKVLSQSLHIIMDRHGFVKIINYVQIVPAVQLFPIQPAAQVEQDPSVCRHVSDPQ